MSKVTTQRLREIAEDMADDIDGISVHSCSSISSSVHSERSESSTIGYSQESWNDFKPRVEELCGVLWAPRHSFGQSVFKGLRSNRILRYLVPPTQAPFVERLRGGDYNRITGITLPSTQGKDTQKLILRTSRWDEGRPERETTILNYVHQRTSIPVPEIVVTDFSSDNALGKPYVVQRRIPGGDLNSLWNSLNHAQRSTIACELGGVVKTLLSLESPVPGLIEVTSPSNDLAHPTIIPFEMKEPGGELIEEFLVSQKDAPQIRQTVGEFFKHQFGTWKAYALARPFERDITLYSGLFEAVLEMDDLGLFNTSTHCLCHVDLHSRNIMAEIQPDNSIKITAILDWDEAVVAPKFVNCQPPWWLWEEEGDERVDENGIFPWPYELEASKDFPSTPENQELKRLFEEHAGPEWRFLAYDEASRLSRGLFVLAKEGMPASEHYKTAERILREWKILRNSLMSQRA